MESDLYENWEFITCLEMFAEWFPFIYAMQCIPGKLSFYVISLNSPYETFKLDQLPRHL